MRNALTRINARAAALALAALALLSGVALGAGITPAPGGDDGSRRDAEGRAADGGRRARRRARPQGEAGASGPPRAHRRARADRPPGPAGPDGIQR